MASRLGGSANEGGKTGSGSTCAKDCYREPRIPWKAMADPLATLGSPIRIVIDRCAGDENRWLLIELSRTRSRYSRDKRGTAPKTSEYRSRIDEWAACLILR